MLVFWRFFHYLRLQFVFIYRAILPLFKTANRCMFTWRFFHSLRLQIDACFLAILPLFKTAIHFYLQGDLPLFRIATRCLFTWWFFQKTIGLHFVTNLHMVCDFTYFLNAFSYEVLNAILFGVGNEFISASSYLFASLNV